MAKPDLRRFKLLKRSPAGKISVQEISAEAVQVEGSHAYTIVESTTGKLPKALQARRVGDDLQVFADGEPAVRLEGFYKPVNGNTAFDGSGELFAPVAGSYDSGYALLTGDPLNASDKVMIGKATAAESSGSLSGWGWAGLAGLGLAGAAIAGGSSSGNSGSGSNAGTGGIDTGGSTPGGSNPGGSNPGGSNPGGSNPGGSNPGTGNTGGQTVGPVPISSRAGFVGIEGLGGARVQILHDANGNGVADAGEGSSAIILSRNDTTARGQFEIPSALPAPAYDASRSLLQLTSSGGTTPLLGAATAITGPVQSMAILTRPVDPDATRFDAVLSPISTLGSHLLRSQLQNGVPADLDKTLAYGEHLSLLADVMGLSMPAERLMSFAPASGPVQRMVIERQLNALLVATVALASGKADSQSPGWSGAATADIASRLGVLIENEGSLDLTDPAQLQNLLAGVLPLSLPVAGLLADGLAPLMSALAMAADGDQAASLLAQSVLPSLANTMAFRHANLIAGTLDDPAVSSAIKAELDVLGMQLARAVRDSAPSTRVIVNSDGAYLDRNADDRLDALDKVNGSLVTASFASGGNADPAAGRVLMTWQFLPGAGNLRPPATLTADDRVEIALDAVNQSHRLDLSWSASDANLMLKTVQDKGLVTDLSIAARERGSSALVSIGRFAGAGGPAGDPVTSALGAVSLLAAGSASDATVSNVDLKLAFGAAADGTAGSGGRIAGPLRLQAGGMKAQASANIQSLAALDVGDVTLTSTALEAKATGYLRAGGSGQLKLGQASLVSHAMNSATELALESGTGGVRTERGISALANGHGSTSIITVQSTGGALIGAGTTATSAERMISVTASGDAYRLPGTTQDIAFSRASLLVVSETGPIAVRDVSVVASGRDASATLTLQSMQGTILIDGATRVLASGQSGDASLMLTAASQTAAQPAITLTGPVTIEAADDHAAASMNATATAGALRLASTLLLRASGTEAMSSVSLEATGGSIAVEGATKLEASGYAAKSELTFKQPASGPSALSLATLEVQTQGALSRASVLLERPQSATGSITLNSLSVSAAADHTVLTDQVVVQLDTASGSLVAGGSISIQAAGASSGVSLEAGSAASNVTLSGRLTQKSSGYLSRSQVSIESGATLAIAQGIALQTESAGSVLNLTLNADRALQTGDATTAALEGHLIVNSQGLNSSTSIALNTDGATVYFGGDVELTRNALTAAGLDRSTRLNMSSSTVNLVIDGRLALIAETGAVNGKLQANLHAKSVHDASAPVPGNVPAAELATISIGGELLVQSKGFNTLTELTAAVTGPAAMIDIGSDFSVISERSGNLVSRTYGAVSKMTITGNGASLQIAGDWHVKSGELGNARSEVELDLKGGNAGASVVGDDLTVSALGYGSRATTVLSAKNSLSPGLPLTVTDQVEVLAMGAGASAVLSGNALITAGGGVSVIADSGIGAPGGAYAALSARTISLNHPEPIFVDAVRGTDIAVLTMTDGVDGARFRLGSAGSAGAVYLDTGKSFASSINIDFTTGGVAFIAIGVEDRDLSTDDALENMMVIDGVRFGKEALVLTEGLRSVTNFVESGSSSSPSSSVRDFLATASSRLAGRGGGWHAGSVLSEDASISGRYLAFDYDGSGLTGLIFFGPQMTFPEDPFATPSGTAFDPFTPNYIFVDDPASETNTTGDVNRGTVVVNASPGEYRFLSLESKKSMVILDSLHLSANSFSVAEGYLSGISAHPRPTVLVREGAVTVEAYGLHSTSALTIASEQELLELPSTGLIRLESDLFIRATGDKSLASTILSGDHYTVRLQGILHVEAAGIESAAKLVMHTTSSTALGMLANNDIVVNAAGAMANAELSFEARDSKNFDAQRNMTVQATGDASVATTTVDVRNGFMTILSVETLAEAPGAKATATFGNQNLKLHSDSTFSGYLRTAASGEESQATTTVSTGRLIDVPVMTTYAIGAKSKANTDIKSAVGNVMLDELSTEASGVGAQATSSIDVGAPYIVTVSQVDPEGGNVMLAQGLRGFATGLGSITTINIKAWQGNVSLRFINSFSTASHAETTVRLEAGSKSRDESPDTTNNFLIASGYLLVSGSVSALAGEAYARSSVILASHAQMLAVWGDMSLRASGAHSYAGIDARAYTFRSLPDVVLSDLRQAPVSVSGALAVEASGTQARASALLESGRGVLEVKGGLKVTSLGVEADSKAALEALHGTIRVDAEAQAMAAGSLSKAGLTLTTGTSAPGIPDEGSIRFAKGLAVLASGTNALADAVVTAQSGGTITVGGAVRAGAFGDHAIATLALSAAGADSGGAGGAPLVRALSIAGPLQVEATGTHAMASAVLKSGAGSWSVSGVSVLASGQSAEASLTATEATAATIAGMIQSVSTGDSAATEVTIKSTSGDLSVTGNLLVLATGDGSDASTHLSANSGKLAISGDVDVASFGEDSLASVELTQRPANDVSVGGRIRVMADSGEGSAVGARATASLALGRLQDTDGTELLVGAVQSTDSASVSLKLFQRGGEVQLGGTDQSGTASLTLLGKTLVDEVEISFQGTAGKAKLSLEGENLNATTASDLSVMMVDGFRIAQDSIRFESDDGALTSFTSTDAFSVSGFLDAAISHFANTAVGKGLYGAVVSGDLYVAYDYDSNGVDGVVALDDVTLAQFRQYISNTGLG